jgi:uncharacterized protein (TIGR02646 family)
MRKLEKMPIPAILDEKHDEWLTQFLADTSNKTKKYRYRHEDIKRTLKKETFHKCIYCESKIGHNVPGDVEHIVPTSKIPNLHFNWENLSIACPECNRRKNSYYEEGEEFLNPYADDVESAVEHYGPIMGWANGNSRAEITIKTLELDTRERFSLISRKIEKIEELNNDVERYTKEANPDVKALIKHKIARMEDRSSEYSGMIRSIIEYKNIPFCI